MDLRWRCYIWRTSLADGDDTICDLASADIERGDDYKIAILITISARVLAKTWIVAHSKPATSPVILGIVSSGTAVAQRAATPPSVEKAPEGDAMKRILFGVALASVLAVVPVAAAPRTQASIILNAPAQLSSSFAASSASTAWPTLGDFVTFTVTYPDSLRSNFVYVQVACYQGPDHVFTYGATNTPDGEFLLGGTNSHWLVNGGPASCVAELFYWSKGGKYTLLASTDFEVAG